MNWSKEFRLRNKPFVEELLNSSHVSESCSKSIFSTLDGIERLDDWSIQMINSWADFPPKGLFEGSLTDFGSYDQFGSVLFPGFGSLYSPTNA
ncbi:unnamed protein product, partial [Medioppia subpectinata]